MVEDCPDRSTAETRKARLLATGCVPPNLAAQHARQAARGSDSTAADLLRGAGQLGSNSDTSRHCTDQDSELCSRDHLSMSESCPQGILLDVL
jgi:hypothetical protein